MHSPYPLSHEHKDKESIWWIERINTWDRCYVREGEVKLVWQQQLPDDPYPEIDSLSFPIAHFLYGEGQSLIEDIFGQEALNAILTEARRRNPRVQPQAPSQPSQKRRPPNPEAKIEKTRTNESSGWGITFGLIVLLGFAGWIVYWPSLRVARWYDVHTRQSLEKIDAIVLRSGVDPFTTYVRNSTLRGFHGTIHVSYPWKEETIEAAVRVRQYTGTDADRATKQLSQEFPDGATIPLYVLSQEPRHPAWEATELRPGLLALLRDIGLILFGATMGLAFVMILYRCLRS